MAFFEPPPRVPEPPAPKLPEWIGPPEEMRGGVVALGLIAARSDQAVVLLESATAYPTGVEFRVRVSWREQARDIAVHGAPWHHELHAGEELPDQLFRVGIQLADGSKATSLGSGLGAVALLTPGGGSPPGPVLLARGGGGGSSSWSQDLWLWPLPPPGDLAFVCEWPALGIELTHLQLDSSELREAATRCRPLWSDESPPQARA
jgi:hypothetical protein